MHNLCNCPNCQTNDCPAAAELEALQRQVAALKVEYAKQPEWTKRFLEQQSEIDSLRTQNRELREALELLSNYSNLKPQWGRPDVEYFAKQALAQTEGEKGVSL